MASAQLLKITHNIDDKVTGVSDDVRGVGEKVQVVNDNVKAVDDIVQTIATDGKEVKVTATKVQSIVEKMADDVDDVKRNQLQETLRKWQCPPDPSTNHNFASERQHEGTAKWFFKEDKLKEWKVTGSLLWIHGKPGSGKSVLCSAIINDIATLCEAGSALMAYFYFDFRDINKKARRSLLSSLLIQLSSRSNSYCEIFFRLYKAHDNGGRQPSDNALMQCLKEMLILPSQRPVYLIMDAIDECPDTSGFPSARALVLDLVQDLVDLRLPSLHICVTSRLEVDVSDALESLASHIVSLQDEDGQKKDIAEYVRSVVLSGSGKFMRRWKQEDKEQVIKALSESAGGMFRWVFCQLEMLQNCLPQNVQHVLRELPESLDETYERVLMGIGKANRRHAHRLLQCLTVATRPLRVEELAEVLALDYDGAKDGIPALNKDWRWEDQQQGVLSTCSSLIVVVNDRNTRVVQFAHFSVKEFLTSDRLAGLQTDISHFHISLEPAHTTMAQACLGILLQSDNKSVDKSQVKDSPPPGKYAAQYWVTHAQFQEVSLRVEVGMQHLFDPAKPYFAAWLKLHDIDEAWSSFLKDHNGLYDINPSRKPSSSEDYASLCLYYASFCGFRDLTKYLIVKGPQNVNARVGLNMVPLAAALCNRHIQVAELLHQHGALPNIVGYHGRTLLHAASMDGLVDVAQWLLNIGADINARQDDHTTPLHFAAAKGHLELVRTLLGHGVDVNAANKANRTPLHEASASGHVDIARLLIQHGADAKKDLQKLLLLASSSISAETVQLFIQLGADVNAKDGSHKTPLHLASYQGNVETVQLLIEHGAGVNARDESQQTPLHLASSRGNAITARVLLEHGADVDARDGSDQTPLHLASSRRGTGTVRVLLEHGADVNARDGRHRMPLHLASTQASAETVQVLIEHGAELNAQDEYHSTPLDLAASWWNTGIVKLLKEHGAVKNR